MTGQWWGSMEDFMIDPRTETLNRTSGTQSRNNNYQGAMADLTRDQWNDFKNRFLPVQKELFSLATSDKLLTEQLDRNAVNIDRSFANADQNESMRLGRYGLTAEDSKQNGNNTNLLKSLTTASVNNETRGAIDELQNKIITGQGGAPKSLADIGGKG